MEQGYSTLRHTSLRFQKTSRVPAKFQEPCPTHAPSTLLPLWITECVGVGRHSCAPEGTENGWSRCVSSGCNPQSPQNETSTSENFLPWFNDYVKNWGRIKLFIQEEMHWIFMKSLFAELPFSWLKRVINAVSQFRGGLGVTCFLHLVNSSVCSQKKGALELPLGTWCQQHSRKQRKSQAGRYITGRHREGSSVPKFKFILRGCVFAWDWCHLSWWLLKSFWKI